MNDSPLRTAYEGELTPRRWYLRVCECGAVALAGTPCAGFPGAWNEETSDFDRVACIGEVVEVVEVGL